MEIITVGYDKRMVYAREMLLKGDSCRGGCVHLLPVPTSRDGEHITGTDIMLTQYLERVSGGDTVVCYGVSTDLTSHLALRGIKVVELSCDEEYICEGARLTALGTLGHILALWDAAPCDLRIGVIGLGRIGGALCNMLVMLGCRVVAFSGRQSQGDKRITVMGYDTLASGDFPPLDLLVNTAPSRLIPSPMPSSLFGVGIIELASGDNLPSECEAVRLPALPARAFPKSAGYSVARAVLRSLKDT